MRTTISRNRHVGCWSGIRSSTGDGQNEILRKEVPDNVAMQQIAFASISLTSAETQYSNTEMEALGILYSPKYFTTSILPIRRVC